MYLSNPSTLNYELESPEMFLGKFSHISCREDEADATDLCLLHFIISPAALHCFVQYRHCLTSVGEKNECVSRHWWRRHVSQPPNVHTRELLPVLDGDWK